MTGLMHIDHYISELLFRYDCVVVPGLGGFVCNYAPARIHATQHTFSPPSKQLVFNRNLVHNDGLLAHAVAASAECSYEEALDRVQQFAEACKRDLRKGQKVELKNIGTIWLDPEKNIQFEPDDAVNYLIDSFGLSSFQTFPVKRETYTERREVKTEDRLIPKEAQTENPAARRRVRRMVIATIIAVPLLATAVFIPLKTDLLKGVNVAGFYPFGKKTPALYQQKAFDKSALDTTKFFVQRPQLTPDSNGFAHLDLGLSMVVQLQAPAESTAVAKAVVSQSPVKTQSGFYYVIGGAFAVPENAEKFRSEMAAKGYSVQLLQLKSRLQHISFGQFSSKADADAMLAKVKADQPGAWILHQE